MAVKKKKSLQVVLVEWRDAVSRDEWEGTDVPLHPVLIVSAGIFIRQTKGHLELAVNYDSANSNDSCKMAIPRGMIESIRFIKTLKVRE